MEMNVEKSQVMRISRQASLGTDHQKQLEYVEYFSCLGSVITFDARCTCEIKSRIAMVRAALTKRKALFSSKLLYLEYSFVRC
jgi:hypothetical protein